MHAHENQSQAKPNADPQATERHLLSVGTDRLRGFCACSASHRANVPPESHLSHPVQSNNVNMALRPEAGSMGSSYQKDGQQGKWVRQIPIALLREGTRERP